MKNFVLSVLGVSFLGIMLLQSMPARKRASVSVDDAKVSVSVDNPSKKGRRRRPTYADLLQKAYDDISRDFEEIFEQHESLKKAAPAEYAYYQNQLKISIIQAVEDKRIRGYSAHPLKEMGRSLIKSDYQRIAEAQQGPFMRFKNEFLRQAIECLEYRKSNAKGTPLDASVDDLIAQLKDLKRSLSSVS